MLSENSPNSVVVLTDFRLKPLLSAFDIAKNNPKTEMLTTESNLLFGDYGDHTRPSLRRLAVRILKLFVTVRVLRISEKNSYCSGCRGCMTSMVSITQDAAATPDLYPELWDRLVDLCSASHSMVQHLESSGARKIFLYNGRVASARAIARRFCESPDHTLRIYEYGYKFGTYRISKYSIHDFAFLSEQLVDMARELDFTFDRKHAEKYIFRKLKNPFTKSYERAQVPGYETVIFGGTPYEYSNALDDRDHLDADPLMMLRTAANHPEFRQPAVFRVHPNASTAANQPQFNQAFIDLCRELEIDVIEAEDAASSHELILGASNVMVGGSSIALDTYFLGKQPIFLGDNTFKGLVEEVEKVFPGDVDNPLKVAGAIISFDKKENPHFPAWVWPVLLIRSGISKVFSKSSI